VSCPTDDQLSAYLAGGLALSLKRGIGRHLDQCDDCKQVVVAAMHAAPPQSASTTLAVGSAVRDPRTNSHEGPVGVGDQLGRYRLIELLGTGGMGQVFCARDLELDRDVALKVLRPGLTGSAELLTARLLRESRLMARLSHPSVVAVYDVGRHGSLVFVAMELIRGTTLTLWLRGSRTVEEVLTAFVSAGRGLVAAHDAGLVHRDFKPDNVLVSVDEQRRLRRVVVTDLGVARALTPSPLSAPPGDPTEPSAMFQPRREDSLSPGSQPARDLDGLTTPGAAVGTPAYMAPEQLEGRAVDRRADVFAFAASLWEALWGSRPFPGRSLTEIAEAMSRPPVKGTARGRVPRRVSKALHAALQIDVERRTPTLAPLLSAIEPQRGRRRSTLAAAIVATAVAASAAGVLLSRRHPLDACEQERDLISHGFAPARLGELRGALQKDGVSLEVATKVVADLTTMEVQWKTAHLHTCGRGHDAMNVALGCLQARRTEMLGALDDLREDRELRAIAMPYLQYVGDPLACERPAAGMLLARIPADPALRAQVRHLRSQIHAAELLRDQGDMNAALLSFRQITAAAEKVWPPLFAEALYAQGTTEANSGDSEQAIETLTRAAGEAEKAHHDRVAATAWSQLINSSSALDFDDDRAMEYATYADAALDRIGRPPTEEILLLYYHGAALAQASQFEAGEGKLRAALALAQARDPSMIALIVQGLGFAYDAKGDYAKAVTMYRQALSTSTDAKPTIAIYRAQLARDLAMLGDYDQALAEADGAIADATGEIDPRNDVWLPLIAAKVLVLRQAGRFEEALAALNPAKVRLEAFGSQHSSEASVIGHVESLLLADLGKLALAETKIGQACDGVGFTTDDEDIDYAGCLADQASIELRLGHLDRALTHANWSIDVVDRLQTRAADVAQVYQVRGEILRRRGNKAAALLDFDRAISMCDSDQADPRFLASARLAKARLLATTDRAAARELLLAAIAAWTPTAAMWKRELDEAKVLLSRLGTPP
jgi:eukaryotic-like serine/threonine-protein kinase